MNIVTFLNQKQDLEFLKASGVKEVIIQGEKFSRLGDIKTTSLNELVLMCKKNGIKAIFSWDILMTEDDFIKVIAEFKKIDLKLFSAIRVQDIGALNYILTYVRDIKIHLILETGNNNFEAISSFSKISKQIERLILSIELPKSKLLEYSKVLDKEIELLCYGRILLSHTPRKLLTNQSLSKEVKISSLESPHSDFDMIENSHGTFLFHNEDFSILEDVSSFNGAITHLRVDNRFCSKDVFKEIFDFINLKGKSNLSEIERSFPKKITKGFFKENSSDEVFKNLKSEKIQDYKKYIGEVVDVNKKNYIAILLKCDFKKVKIGESFKLITPEGKVKIVTLNFMKNSAFEDISEHFEDGLILINHISGISVKSKFYYL